MTQALLGPSSRDTRLEQNRTLYTPDRNTTMRKPKISSACNSHAACIPGPFLVQSPQELGPSILETFRLRPLSTFAHFLRESDVATSRPAFLSRSSTTPDTQTAITLHFLALGSTYTAKLDGFLLNNQCAQLPEQPSRRSWDCCDCYSSSFS